MAELIRYLLLANIFLLATSLFFRLILAREKWFRFNRSVLLGGMISAFIIPLFQLDLLSSPEKALIIIPEVISTFQFAKPDIILQEIQIIGTAPKVFPWISIMQIIYLGGIVCMGIFLVHKITKINHLQRSLPMKWINNLFVSLLPQGNSVFSFLGIIYFPVPFERNDITTKMILKHERVHIEQKHSWDILFIEIVKVLFFYNPSVYSIKKHLELTHEYLADSASAGSDKKKYSLALFNTFFQVPGLALSNGFRRTSTLKRRFIMLESASNPWAGMKYSLILPLLIAFIYLSSLTTVNAQSKIGEVKTQKNIIQTENSVKQMNADNEEKIFFIVEDMPSFNGKGIKFFKKWVQESLVYPEEAKLKMQDGTVTAEFIISMDGEVKNIQIKSGAYKILNDEVIRVLESSPIWKPGKQRGKPVNIKIKIPVHFVLK